MATTIRRLIKSLAWLLVTVVAGMPIFGVLISLWPSVPVTWADVSLFAAYNGLASSVAQSFTVALIAPLIGLYLAFMVFSQYRFHPRWQQLEQRLAPLLSLPHLAVALGLVYLFGTSGMLWNGLWGIFDASAPAWLGLPHKSIFTVMVAISIKEVPFFLLVLSAISRQLPIQQWLLQGRALGYSEALSWWLLVFPAILKQSRLALLAAMAYSLSVLDISILIGPNIPSLYSVVLYQWQTGFNTIDQSHAYLGNLLLLLMLGLLISAIYIHEWLSVKHLKNAAILAKSLLIAQVNRIFVLWLALFSLLSLAILFTFLLWSLGGGQLNSQPLSFILWQEEWFFIQLPLLNSIYLAALSTIIGLALALLALELQRQNEWFVPDYIWLMAILLPQLSMVYGWQLAHSRINGSYNIVWVMLSHLPFTFAYSYLVLRGPFQSLNKHYELVAASLGYSYWQRWWKIRFNLLRPALLTTAAIAFSVSIAQYVPTLLIGAGRIPTITTEAVSIASGNEPSITAIYMLSQALPPFIAFLVAALLAHRFRGSFDAKYH